jgi:iron complex outermembrane receptor protein
MITPLRCQQVYYCRILATLCLFVFSTRVSAQKTADSLVTQTLKKLSLTELMTIEVTSVSKRPEKLSEVASAIQVITQEDIKRSGATTLPEALRLSPNLQVAQVRSGAWIISARGFNAAFSNKLLVLIDGRTVYSPLFAGVFWDAQAVLLENIDRIEVISGPGGTLWGANAVNGVINIITRNAKDTHGLYASVAAGSFLQNMAAVRYGGNIGSRIAYRLNAQRIQYGNTFFANGTNNADSTHITQLGFRMDWELTPVSNLQLLGNFYTGIEKTHPTQSDIDGQNILGKWTRSYSENSELVIQVYADKTWRKDIPSTISDRLNTFDFDLQHRFAAGKSNSILWGTGYRFMQNEMGHSTPFVGILPDKKEMGLFSFFVQDENVLVKERLKLTIGTKLQHNAFSGWELQPSVRLAWTPDIRNTVWGAVSRAVRAPSRIDVDYYLPTYAVPPTSPSVAGGPNFVSEKVVAYELGYRVSPSPGFSLSLATFYNRYDDLYSVEALPGTLTYQIQNGGKGSSWGAELSGDLRVTEGWKIRGGYTFFSKDLKNKPGHTADYSNLGIDPKHQFLIQSMLNLPGHLQLDLTGRYVDSLPATITTARIPAYAGIDLRLAWEYKCFDISLVGRNLAAKRHAEITSTQIPRNFYIKLTCRL